MKVTSHHLPGGHAEIAVTGELDMSTAAQLEKAVGAALSDEAVRAVTIDLAEVTFCDSSGIAVLDHGYGAAVDLGVRLRITNVQPIVARVLEIVGLLGTLTRD